MDHLRRLVAQADGLARADGLAQADDYGDRGVSSLVAQAGGLAPANRAGNNAAGGAVSCLEAENAGDAVDGDAGLTGVVDAAEAMQVPGVTRKCVRGNMRACMRACTRVCVCACARVCVCACVRVCVCVCGHARVLRTGVGPPSRLS